MKLGFTWICISLPKIVAAFNHSLLKVNTILIHSRAPEKKIISKIMGQDSISLLSSIYKTDFRSQEISDFRLRIYFTKNYRLVNEKQNDF